MVHERLGNEHPFAVLRILMQDGEILPGKGKDLDEEIASSSPEIGDFHLTTRS